MLVFVVSKFNQPTDSLLKNENVISIKFRAEIFSKERAA